MNKIILSFIIASKPSL